MFINQPISVFIILQILILLNGIYFTCCQTSKTLSHTNKTIEEKIEEIGGLQKYLASLSPEEEKEYLLLHLQTWDKNTSRIILEQYRIQLSLESQTENTTELYSKEIVPFGIKDYPYTQKDFVVSSTSINEKNINGSKDKVRFYLHTKKNPLNADELFIGDIDGVTQSNFKQNAPLKVLIQGYNATIQTDKFPAVLNASYLKLRTRDLNIILVDWNILDSGLNYIAALHNLQIAAEQIAQFIKFLVEQKLNSLDKVHLIGHSLGAHVAGDTGFYINQLMGQKVSRVTGLDPVRPIFALTDDRGRIDPSDGDFVDIIHTSGLEIGLLRSMGHADFYVNGGLSQPACSENSLVKNFGVMPVMICQHLIAYDYYSESILYPTGFKACKCDDNILSGFSTCHCNGTDSMAYMGDYLSTSTRGIYYLVTNDSPLYGKEDIN